jgi:hypothetical protein
MDLRSSSIYSYTTPNCYTEQYIDRDGHHRWPGRVDAAGHQSPPAVHARAPCIFVRTGTTHGIRNVVHGCAPRPNSNPPQDRCTIDRLGQPTR